MTSQWAADSAVNDYGFPPERISVIPRGANIPVMPSPEMVQRKIDARPTDRCDLIFLGKFWKRKRGDIAEATAVELNRRGLPTTLRLVGGRPEDAPPAPDCVEVVPYINKSTEEGWARFNELLSGAHALLLPTEADCTPIVFCEASAMGTPSISTRTGAVPSVIIEGRNGLLLDPHSTAADYADAVQSMLSDRDAYRSLCLSSYEEYRTRLNWTTSAERAVESFRSAIAHGKRER